MGYYKEDLDDKLTLGDLLVAAAIFGLMFLGMAL
jgi:hypothetical protein